MSRHVSLYLGMVPVANLTRSAEDEGTGSSTLAAVFLGRRDLFGGFFSGELVSVDEVDRDVDALGMVEMVEER